MNRKALAKYGWYSAAGLLLTVPLAHGAQAAPSKMPMMASPVQLAIGNPLAQTTIAGRISVSVAYNYSTGLARINAFTIYVDGEVYSSKSFASMAMRGIHYLEFDTRTLNDGNHTIRIEAKGVRGVLAADEIDVTIRNGIAGGPDIVAPLVQFRGLTDGDTVSGTVPIEVLAEDNSLADPLVSIFINNQPSLIQNRRPYILELNTSKFLSKDAQEATVRLEAWAYDKANNLGKSRLITLKVVPAGPGQLTTKQDDPAALPGPMRQPVQPALADPPTLSAPTGVGGSTAASRQRLPGLRMAKAPSLETQTPVIDPALNRKQRPRRPVANPVAPPSVSAPNTGAASTAVKPATPVPQPTTSATAGPSALLNAKPGSISVPLIVGAPGKTLRSSTPVDKPNGTSAVKPAAPALAPTAVGIKPSLGSTNSGAPTRVAKATPGDTPGGLPELQPVTIAPMKTIPVAPRIAPMPMPAFKPVSKVSAGRLMPSVAKNTPTPMPATGDPMIIIMPPANPDQPGKVEGEVYTVPKSVLAAAKAHMRAAAKVAGMPKDRSYRVHNGESLAEIAKRNGVTVKSLQVANGLTGGVRAGSIIKVPGTFDIVMNNERVAFDVSPRIENGLPIAPFRQIFEHSGGVVVWYADTQEVRGSSEKTEIMLKIGSKEALVNKTVMVMDRAAFIDNGRTIVPINFMEKSLELKAEYDVKNGTIVLVKR